MRPGTLAIVTEGFTAYAGKHNGFLTGRQALVPWGALILVLEEWNPPEEMPVDHAIRVLTAKGSFWARTRIITRYLMEIG